MLRNIFWAFHTANVYSPEERTIDLYWLSQKYTLNINKEIKRRKEMSTIYRLEDGNAAREGENISP